jgi:hypothetical protein
MELWSILRVCLAASLLCSLHGSGWNADLGVLDQVNTRTLLPELNSTDGLDTDEGTLIAAALAPCRRRHLIAVVFQDPRLDPVCSILRFAPKHGPPHPLR